MSNLSDEDRLLIEDSVNKFISDNYPAEGIEKRREQSGRFGSHWHTFAELGWLMLPFSEDTGGMGGQIIDVQVLARAFGRGLIAEPWLETMMAGKILEHSGNQELCETALPKIMSGELVVVTAQGERRVDMDFSRVEATAASISSGYSLNGTKRVVWQAASASQYLVTAMLSGKPAIFLVPANAEGVRLSEYSSVDSRHAADIEFASVSLDQAALVCTGAEAEIALKQAFIFAFGALIAEMRGISEALIGLTADYMNTREQFGMAIANFQALQHMLADMVIAKEEIQSLEWVMAQSAEIEDLDERERIARSSKAQAMKSGRSLCELGIQLHGGVGLTDEYIASHFLRRTLAMDAFGGDSQQQIAWLAGRY